MYTYKKKMYHEYIYIYSIYIYHEYIVCIVLGGAATAVPTSAVFPGRCSSGGNYIIQGNVASPVAAAPPLSARHYSASGCCGGAASSPASPRKSSNGANGEPIVFLSNILNI